MAQFRFRVHIEDDPFTGMPGRSPVAATRNALRREALEIVTHMRAVLRAGFLAGVAAPGGRPPLPAPAGLALGANPHVIFHNGQAATNCIDWYISRPPAAAVANYPTIAARGPGQYISEFSMRVIASIVKL